MSHGTDAAEGRPAPSQERLAALFDSHADRLYRLARRLTPNADEALDLLQDVFLRAAKAPHAVPTGVPGEEAWLVRVLVNIRRDQWRREAVRRRHADRLVPILMDCPSPEASYVRRLAVWQALDRLSPRRRAILVLHELEGLPAPSIAALLGITTVTVRWHLALGRRELAIHIRHHMGGPDEQLDPALAGGRSAPPRGRSS
jgi:RNA polymerase sigma-70 factor (ECF subfamily)